MFSIKKLNQIYNKVYNETNEVSWIGSLFINHYRMIMSYTHKDALREWQWQNLYDVCSIIAANYNRFDMTSFHNSMQGCGTSHCIAGWAVALEVNNPYLDYSNMFDSGWRDVIEKYGLSYIDSTDTVAEAILSRFIVPFFYLTGANSENVLLDEFIVPVIDEGIKDGLILSPRAQDFITKTKQTNQ